jgi:hypothetical protein
LKRVVYSLTLTAEFDPEENKVYQEGLTVEDTVELDRAAFSQNPAEFIAMFPNSAVEFHAQMQERRPALQVVNGYSQQSLF